jgi:hypothetical protein
MHANIINYDPSTGIYQVDKFGANVFDVSTKKKTDVFSVPKNEETLSIKSIQKFRCQILKR